MVNVVVILGKGSADAKLDHFGNGFAKVLQLYIHSYKEDNSMESNEAAIAARRRALAEALRTGEPVVVTATGEVEKKDDAQAQGMTGIQVPDGKLA